MKCVSERLTRVSKLESELKQAREKALNEAADMDFVDSATAGRLRRAAEEAEGQQ